MVTEGHRRPRAVEFGSGDSPGVSLFGSAGHDARLPGRTRGPHQGMANRDHHASSRLVGPFDGCVERPRPFRHQPVAWCEALRCRQTKGSFMQERAKHVVTGTVTTAVAVSALATGLIVNAGHDTARPAARTSTSHASVSPKISPEQKASHSQRHETGKPEPRKVSPVTPSAVRSESETVPPVVTPSASPSEPGTVPPVVTPSASPSEPGTVPPMVTPSASPSEPGTVPPMVTPSASPSEPGTVPPVVTPSASPSEPKDVTPTETGSGKQPGAENDAEGDGFDAGGPAHVGDSQGNGADQAASAQKGGRSSRGHGHRHVLPGPRHRVWPTDAQHDPDRPAGYQDEESRHEHHRHGR
jgi:hypothetical protein